MQSMLWRNVVVLGVGAFALLHCGPGSMPDVTGMDATTEDRPSVMEASPDVPPPMDNTPPPDTTPVACGMRLGSCNPANSEGCGPMQGCYIAGSGGGGAPTGTCGEPGALGLGMRCAGANACQRGLQCLNMVCTRMCCADGVDDPCRVGGSRDICVPLRLTGVTTPLFNCEPTDNCDWFAQDCPMPNQNCLPIRQDGTSQCSPAGTGAADAPCGGSTGVMCGRGLICAGLGGMPPSCRRICNPIGTGDAGVPDGGISMTCPSGQRCAPFSTTDYPPNFGACAPMMM